MQRILSLIAVGCAVALGACWGPTDSHDGTTTDFEQAQLKWATKGSGSYDFTHSQECFCPHELYKQKRISVRDGKVVSGYYIDDNTPVPEEILSGVKTVQEMFAFVDGQLNPPSGQQKDSTFTVTYDPVLGYPTVVSSSRNPAVDAFYTYRMTDLVLKP